MSDRAKTEYRYEKLTWPEINDAIDLGKVCIVPCGAVEQHGPHLPLDVDLVCPTGIAKGAGMIAPDMATMLSFVVTDADINASVLQDMLNRHVGSTFNSVTVDSDTSTSDTLLLFATGAAAAEGSGTLSSASDPRGRGFSTGCRG